jgi:orotate phosphoribosyltransferase-like protein/transposase
MSTVPKVWTIYQVVFRATGQIVYVGQTTKQPAFLRWAYQIEAAHRTAPADRTLLQAAICENGADALAWAMIETWPTQKAADMAETRWILELRTLHPHGLNIHISRGGQMRPERREKWRQGQGARRAAMTAKILALDDAGRSRDGIAAELELSQQWIGELLRRAGRKMDFKTRGQRNSQAARAALHARMAPIIERAAAMQAEGASWAEIGAAIGRSALTAGALVKRARQDGRLPPAPPETMAERYRRVRKSATATRQARALALFDAGRTRQQIADALGLSAGWISALLRRAGRPRQRCPQRLLERAAAMRRNGATWAEVGTVLGLSEGSAYNLLQRACTAGRLPPDLDLRRIPRRQRQRGAPRRTTRPSLAETTAKALALLDSGLTRAEIATELALGYRHICNVLRFAGRQILQRPRTAGVLAYNAAQRARTLPMIRQAVALEAAGKTWVEIGAALGVTGTAAWALVDRARKDGRLPAEQLELSV